MRKKQSFQNESPFLLAKYAGNQEIQDIIKTHYGSKIVTMVEGGSIDFDPNGLKSIAHGEKLTYDDYLDAQIQAIGKTHAGFQTCFYNIPLEFKGCVEKISEKHICFQKIYISGMYPDGTCFEDKEQHVWMDLSGFEGIKIGDSVSFCADTYRYLKTGNGKMIDFGIRNPVLVRKIGHYALPTDDELLDQMLDSIVCDSCFLFDTCNKQQCIRSSRARAALKCNIKRHVKGNRKSG